MEPEQLRKERRSSRRLDMEKELITIKWEEANIEQSGKATCLDVSSSGLKISFDRTIQIGQNVEVTFEGKNNHLNVMQATALYSEQKEHGWFEIAFTFDHSGENK